MRTIRLLAVATAILVLAGCAGTAGDAEPTEPPGVDAATPQADADVTPPPGVDVPVDPQDPDDAEAPADPPHAEAAEDAGDVGDPAAAEQAEVWDLDLVGPDGGTAHFAIEVVADPPSRQQGLMHRTELAADAGMLFLFPGEHRGGFWMKNTLIPLSIAYLGADGEVLSIMDMDPCEADPCPSYDPGVPYAAALEVNQGAFGEAGVAPGWRADLPADLPPPS